MDTERILDKLDRMDEKLDNHLNRIAVLETKFESMSGFVKFGFSLIVSTVTGILAWVGKELFTK